jgi:hypothetical protein
MASIRQQNDLEHGTAMSGGHFALGSLPFWRLEGIVQGFMA